MNYDSEKGKKLPFAQKFNLFMEADIEKMNIYLRKPAQNGWSFVWLTEEGKE